MVPVGPAVKAWPAARPRGERWPSMAIGGQRRAPGARARTSGANTGMTLTVSHAMPRIRRLVPALACALAVLGAAQVAYSQPRHTCELGEPDAITVDGMLDDWQGIGRARVGGADHDASFDLRCLYDGKNLALSIDVRDEHVVRGRRPGRGDDQLELRLAAGAAPLTITIVPGLGKLDPVIQVGGRKAPRWLAAETTLQPRGWSVELTLPLARVRGYGPATPQLSADVRYRDGDVPRGKAPERTVGETLALVLAGKADVLAGFLKATGLGRGDLRLDTRVDVDPAAPGRERVVAGKRVVGVIEDRFGYIQLPAERDDDVLAVRVADLRGDGSRVILAVVRQRGAGASRDLLLGYGARGGRIGQLFAIDIRKERGASRLESTWRLVTRGRGRHKRPALEVKARPAVGWDIDSYGEDDATDAVPIALPWDDNRWGATYWLDGDQLQSRPLPGKRPQR